MRSILLILVLLFSGSSHAFFIEPFSKKNQVEFGGSFLFKPSDSNIPMLYLGIKHNYRWAPLFLGLSYAFNYRSHQLEYPNYGAYNRNAIDAVLSGNIGLKIYKKKKIRCLGGISALLYSSNMYYKTSNSALRPILGEGNRNRVFRLSTYLRAEYKFERKYSCFLSNQIFSKDKQLYCLFNAGLGYHF